MLGKSQRKRTLAKPAPRKSLAGGGGRILTTHVGSLIRPVELQELLKARRDSQAYDKAAFDACLHDCVADVVRKQADIGLDIINDGGGPHGDDQNANHPSRAERPKRYESERGPV